MAETTRGVQLGVPGRARAVAKLGLEEVIWGRVAMNNLRHRRPELPAPVIPTDLLATTAQWQAATAECRQLGLILHHDGPKNWDALGAVSTLLHELGTDIRVLDAGAARYSNVLPSLALYGVRELIGNNLEFDRTRSHGKVRFEPGDVTAMMYRDGWFDAVTCMSVVEHGVPIDAFFREVSRVLRPGGLLIVSTDYSQRSLDTAGKTAYGVPVRIFGPDDIHSFVDLARTVGLELVGDLRLDHTENPVRWKRVGLDYTFIRLTFRKAG